MRRIVPASLAILALVLALVLAGVQAGAEKQWVGREEFIADPGDPAVVRFAVDVREPGSYQVYLSARGEAKRQIELALSLQPEAGGAERTVQFSFTGAGCG
jgi:hypothetical protein